MYPFFFTSEGKKGHGHTGGSGRGKYGIEML